MSGNLTTFGLVCKDQPQQAAAHYFLGEQLTHPTSLSHIYNTNNNGTCFITALTGWSGVKIKTHAYCLNQFKHVMACFKEHQCQIR